MFDENNTENDPIFTIVVDKEHKDRAVIKVVGVGGGGGNAVQYMIEKGLSGVEFITMNTDAQALKNSCADTKVQLGVKLTKGLGAGANPQIGYQSAMENKEQIRKALLGADIVFIAVGMGGGTGTGASPVVAEIAKELNALTIAVVTKPSYFEGKKRMNYAEQGIELLANHIDSLLTLPNDKLQKSLPKGVPFLEALKASNGVLYEAVSGFSTIINEEDGLINLDYADLRTVNSGKGTTCVMGVGRANGDDRVNLAVKEAMLCPLLEDVDLANISRMLVHIVAGSDFSLEEYNLAGDALKAYVAEDSEIIIGVTVRQDNETGVNFTVIATCLEDKIASHEEQSCTAVNALKSLHSKTNKARQDKLVNNDLSEADELDKPAYLRQDKYVDISRFY
ncbi:MAG: cell division protein FtsZ [Psychromonas sp.]